MTISYVFMLIQDISMLIPDFYEILELDEGSDDSGAHVSSFSKYGKQNNFKML